MGEAKRRKAAEEYPDTSKERLRIETVAWEVVGDTAAHPKSQHVLDALAKLASEHQDGDGNTMVVVLEDEARKPIIRASTRGLSAFMDLVGEMQNLKLSDRLEDEDGPERGVDAAFS